MREVWAEEFRRWTPELLVTGRSYFSPLGTNRSIQIILDGNETFKNDSKVKDLGIYSGYSQHVELLISIVGNYSEL